MVYMQAVDRLTGADMRIGGIEHIGRLARIMATMDEAPTFRAVMRLASERSEWMPRASGSMRVCEAGPAARR